MRAGRSYGNNLGTRVRNLPPVVYVVAGGGGAYYIYHLERTETGRLRFMDTSEISERQMGDAVSRHCFDDLSHFDAPPGNPRDIAAV